MESKDRQIKDLKKKIELAHSAIDVHYEHIGEVAFSAEAEKKENSSTAEILKEIGDINAEVERERERIAEILSAVERADEIEALRKSLIRKIKSIEKDNISNYETIGRASYEAYKDGELSDEKYAAVFSEVVKLNERISKAEAELSEIEDDTDSSNLFDKVKKGTRAIYLKNVVSGNYNLLKRQYKKAGEEICHSDLVMNLEAESVENAVKPVKENLEGIEELSKEEQKLSSETQKLKGNLENLGVKSSAVRTVNDIEKRINELYSNRKQKQHDAGEKIYLNRKDDLAKLAKVKKIFKDIEREKEEIESCGSNIKRLEAEIEIERQNREIKNLNKKINGYEEKISNYNQEAEELKAQIQKAEKSIKKLETTVPDPEEKNG